MRSVIAAAVIALAVPATASAHPGVYTVTQKIAGAGCTFPTTGCLTDRTQYAVANDGWTLGFTEDNTNPGGGLINYKAMPSSWRTPMTPEEKRSFAGAQTSLQAHATCSGTALDNGPSILAWQGNDPFFNYVPFQSKSAGLGDDPAKWIPVVKSVLNVDLTGMSDAQAQAACTGAGGTYRKADTPASIADALLASVTSPLQSQVSQLQNQVGVLQAAKAAADAAALDRPLALTPSSKTFDTPVAMVTGLPGTAVTVKVLLGAADAKRLKVSRTAAKKTRTLGAAGAELFTLKPSKKVAASKRALKVTIEAAGGGKTLTSKGTLR
jgi:hypothetical protein